MSTAEVWVHNLDPVLFQITDGIAIRWYGLSYLAGFIAAYWVIQFLIKKGRSELKPDQVIDFITYVAIGTMIGGRLGYCLFYSPELFLRWSSQFPFWGVLEVHRGGMASHGGIAGVILGAMYYAHRQGISKLHVLDLAGLTGGIGIFFGRIANFINGELFGREAPAGTGWAVKFPSEVFYWWRIVQDRWAAIVKDIPSFGDLAAGESASNLSRWATVSGDPQVKALLASEEVERLRALGPATETLTRSIDSTTWQRWVDAFPLHQNSISYALDDMVRATQAHSAPVLEALAPLLTARYPSQLIQALLEGLFITIILALFWRKPRAPGLISAGFGILYAIGRFIGERFRMPDADIGFQWLGLTRGQILSLVMLLMVVVYAAYLVRRSNRIAKS